MRHCGTHGTIFRLRGHSLLQCWSCSTLHIVCFHPETPLGLEIWRKTSLNTQNGTSGCKHSIWAAALHLGCAVFIQHIINYRAGKIWVTPVQEKVCKGHSISFSFGKGTFVSSLVNALQWCQLPIFSYWRSTNQMNSSTPMWSGYKWSGSSLPTQYTCLYARTFWFCFLLNSCQWSKSWTRQPGYTADLLTCFSPGLLLSCQ